MTEFEAGACERAADLARQAESIAEDVNAVCHEHGIGSLSLAVMLLSNAVEALAGKWEGA